MINKLLCIQSGMSSHINVCQKIKKIPISLLISRVQSDVFFWKRSSGPKCRWMAWKIVNNLEADILPATGTGKSSTLDLHHNLQDLMLGIICSLEVSDTVLAKHRKSQRGCWSHVIRIIKWCIQLWYFDRVSEGRIKTLLKACNCLV